MGALSATIIVLTIIDFLFFGFILWLFRISPGYRALLAKGILIEEKKFGYLSIPKSVGYYRSIILTPDHIILKQNYLTSLINLKKEWIKSYKIKNGNLGLIKCKIIVYIEINSTPKILQFITNKANDWIVAFKKIGIHEK
jgi:hypothetical protein